MLIVSLNISLSLFFFKQVGFIIIPIATSLSTWVGVILYFIILNKYNYFYIVPNLVTNIFKIILSTILMSLILIYGLNYFQDNLDYFNRFKSIYLLIIIGFVTTIYLISCYLLGVLKVKNYKTN